MVKNESMRLVTFTTEESTEESKKSMEESKNGWRNNGGRKQEHLQWASKCAELGLGEEEGDGRYIKGGPLVPVGGSNRD